MKLEQPSNHPKIIESNEQQHKSASLFEMIKQRAPMLYKSLPFLLLFTASSSGAEGQECRNNMLDMWNNEKAKAKVWASNIKDMGKEVYKDPSMLIPTDMYTRFYKVDEKGEMVFNY